MRKLLKVIAALVLAGAVLIGGGILLAKGGVDNPISEAVDQAGTGAANAALDAIGIKDKADAILRDNAGRISEMTGLPRTAVDSLIDGLDIQSWQVTTLPSDAVPQGTTSIPYDGMDVTLTTYDDPSIVTVQTSMGAVTLAVPASAQGTIEYLRYL